MTRLRARKQLEEVLKKRLSSLEVLHATLLRVEMSASDIEVRLFVLLVTWALRLTISPCRS